MNLDTLSDVLRLLEGSRVAELELKGGAGTLLRLRRHPAPSARQVSPSPSVSPITQAREESPAITRVEALLVGRYHVQQNLPTVGDIVEEDQIIGAVESMGLMNAVTSPVRGRLTALHVEDMQIVEYGQLLFEIEPD